MSKFLHYAIDLVSTSTLDETDPESAPGDPDIAGTTLCPSMGQTSVGWSMTQAVRFC